MPESGPLPLEGLRILAVEQFGAGPLGTMILADLGAEVIKIENPATQGDSARPVPPYPLPNNDSYYFQGFNRNKKSVALDIVAPEGREILHKLVARSDVLFSNCKGTDPEKLQLTYKHLGLYNERLVCCFLSGFGMTGPRASEPAYDYLMQAYAGIMSLTGEPGAPPAKAGVSFVDYSGGYLGMLGLMTGLWEVSRTGRGRDIDVSLLEGAAYQLGYLATWALNCGHVPQRFPHSAHPSLVPSQNFETKDGWVSVLCMKHRFYPILVEKMGRRELAADPRFRTQKDRFDNRDALLEILSREFRTRTTAEWSALLAGHVPFAPVNTVVEALEDPQIRARGMIVEVEHPAAGIMQMLGCPIRVPGARMRWNRAPYMGEHTREVLCELAGLREGELEALRTKGVVEWTEPSAPEGRA
ncbi:MAG: CoA transferase [Candidatus Tectomicrobia bacterium]|uniref:CoA transferase n=1 Tax=Tectimicrobiota bacterium TaxID=2528274 RepID=A0A932HXH7_UNCTE|nr:CoA transferase [Candidatus Tectomicrobia bacterium]